MHCCLSCKESIIPTAIIKMSYNIPKTGNHYNKSQPAFPFLETILLSWTTEPSADFSVAQNYFRANISHKMLQYLLGLCQHFKLVLFSNEIKNEVFQFLPKPEGGGGRSGRSLGRLLHG